MHQHRFKRHNSLTTTIAKCCRVCGDQAFAFNYNGLTCESCKSFFRRNAHFNVDSFICKRGGDCTIDKTSRRYCQKCRLKKCLQIGMRKELLRNSFSSTSSQDDDEEEMPKEVNQLTNQLPPYEHHCIEVVKKITHVFSEKPISKVQITGYAHHISQLYQKKKNFVHQISEFGRCIEGFTSLKQEDQLALLSTSFSEILLMRSAFHFNCEKDSLIVLVDSESNTGVYARLDMFYGCGTNYMTTLHRTLAYLVRDLMDRDELLLELIAVLLVFQNQIQTTCPELVRYYYTKYCHLVEKYLQNKYQSPEYAKEKYQKLLQVIDSVGPLKRFIQEILVHMQQMEHKEDFRKYIDSIIDE